MMEPKPNPFLVASLMSGDGAQTLLHLTLATAVVVALVIFVTAFLLGAAAGCGGGGTGGHRRRLI